MEGVFRRSFRDNESGATAALYALALPALVAVAGIGFDYAHIASLDTELQNAADQAALAGATQLDQSTDAIDRAIDAVQGGLVANQTFFANDGQDTNVDVPTEQIFFYATRADAENATNAINPDADDADAEARFIRVVVETRTANYALTPVVGAFKGDIFAEAVAGIGSALCRTPPLMICNPDEDPDNEDPTVDFNANDHIGEGLLVKGGGGNAWAPGNFGYLDTIPGGGVGTPELQKALGWDIPPGTCVSQEDNEAADPTVDTTPGNHAAVADAINTRFDIYEGSNACWDPGNCPASANSMKDVVHPADFDDAQACTIHNDGWQESTQPYLPNFNEALDYTRTDDPDVQPTSMGHPRDVCHSTANNECGSGDDPFGDGFWDRDAYFLVNYGWAAADWPSYTGFTPSGPAGRPNRPTRYDVYKWEMNNRNTTVGGVTVLGQRTLADGNGSYPAPQCSQRKTYGSGTVPSDTVADRRRLSVAVVNCAANNVGGKSDDVSVRRWMDIFLVEPSLDRTRTSKDEIYVEIIGETSRGSAGETAGTVIRRDVPYLIR